MPGTFPIPQASYDPAHGPYLFGPQNVNPNDKTITLTIDRTVTGGLNSVPGSTAVELNAEQSNDSGATWFIAVGGTMTGGQMFNTGRHGDGSLITQSTSVVSVYGSGPGRQLRASLTVSGSPVVLAGTVAVT